MRSSSIFFATIFLLVQTISFADQNTGNLPKSLQALRVNHSMIVIDGVLDEAEWRTVLYYSDFIQRDPVDGDPASEKTEFAILYDDEYLYVGIKAYSKDPSTIKGIMSRRDEETPSDWLYVSLDSYDDNRTAFEFGLNPAGVKHDLRRYDDENRDSNWDALWEGRTTMMKNGWCAEFRIPFRELRFDSREKQTWGLQINRFIAEKNEDTYWTQISKEEQGWVSHYGELNGLEKIPRQHRIYITPYITGQYNKANYLRNPVHSNSFNTAGNFGADLKIGVTNNLTLDLTFNPDFGQVEADPAELNLSAFESYFSEKRPFFVEGGNIYNFSLGIGDGDGANTGLFYTRRIGRSPHNYVSHDDGYETNPTVTSILTAGKLSGKTSSGWSIGMMDAVAGKEVGLVEFENDSSYQETVEPTTNYFVTRLQKDFREGNTSIGGMFTATNRKINDDYLEWLHTDAYGGGLDINHRFLDNRYFLEAAIAATNVIGSREALLETQTSSSHYYQRPDANHLEVDSSRTSLQGYAHKFAFGKIGGEHWRYMFGEQSTSPGFEPNDIGYNRETDSRSYFFWCQYREDTPSDKLRRYSINFNTWQGRNYGDESPHYGGNINAHTTFNNYWSVGGGVNIGGRSWHRFALWGGPSLRMDPSFNTWGNVSSDNRKDFTFNISGHFGGQTTGSRFYGLSPNICWRPANNFTMRIYLRYRVLDDNWSTWGDYEATVDSQSVDLHADFLMSDLYQETFSATLRMDFTLTPNLTLQFYGSPYVTAGKFFNFKKVANAHSDNWDDRYDEYVNGETSYDAENDQYSIDSDMDGVTNYTVGNYDFNYKQFNSNLVLRWEYLPGSTLYLVWSNGLSEYIEGVGEMNFLSNSYDMLNLDAENIVMLKFSYLLNI
ncbi:MAG: carbohydrate binding family 9 domain-containing protein [Candidatus Marinimicrobia bacterium]|nr:carbohydrate binding family 9 domain-containing protein [Candidatus Neomarinimicrobiota bacterium]